MNTLRALRGWTARAAFSIARYRLDRVTSRADSCPDSLASVRADLLANVRADSLASVRADSLASVRADSLANVRADSFAKSLTSSLASVRAAAPAALAVLAVLLETTTPLSAVAGNLAVVGEQLPAGALHAREGWKGAQESSTIRTYAALTASELNALADYNVVLIIDRSLSMGRLASSKSIAKADQTSRWEWCRRQTIDLTGQTVDALPDGVNVVLFSSSFTEYNDVRPHVLDSLFSENKPRGKTELAGALKAQLDQHFANRASGNTKPLLVAVITDGCPDSPDRLRETIVDATHRMRAPDEIAITFLQIGSAETGTRFLTSLNRKLKQGNAKYNIVTVKSFDQVNTLGLGRALVEALSKTRFTAKQPVLDLNF